MTSYGAGRVFEMLSIVYLMLKGYRILKWRYKTRYGEIDLIAKRGSLVVFVEVKKRQSLLNAGEAISKQSQGRIVKSAQQFLQAHKDMENHFEFRFDALLWLGFLRVSHVKAAFYPF